MSGNYAGIDPCGIEALDQERKRNAVMEAKGFITAPHGGWIRRTDWIKHIRMLRKRSEQSPQWAP
jgi:hypothetical protein